MQMSIYFGFVNGASHHTSNLALAAWVVYSHDDELVSLGGFFLGPTTNNVEKYHVDIGLLTKYSSLGISHMVILLDSQLMVSQLNLVYVFRNPIFLQPYLRICFLERSFDYIHYEHIPKELNTMRNLLANYILNWHLPHILIVHTHKVNSLNINHYTNKHVGIEAANNGPHVYKSQRVFTSSQKRYIKMKNGAILPIHH